MVYTWPYGLPALRGQLNSAGSDQLFPANKETTFDDGPDRSRVRTLFIITPLKMELHMSVPQFQIFMAFYRDKLVRGNKRFVGPVLTSDLKTTADFTCKIKGPVLWSARTPTQYKVSFLLHVQDWK